MQAAILHGWMVHAERPAMGQRGEWRTHVQGHAGLPDLILVRANRLMFVELKRKPNKLEAEQIVWADRLIEAGAEYRLLWVPEMMPAFLEELR